MITMTATAARAALPDLLNRVEAGEEVTITRHGRAVGVLVRPDALRNRRSQPALTDAAKIDELLSTARQQPIPRDRGLTKRRADELVRDIATGRDR